MSGRVHLDLQAMQRIVSSGDSAAARRRLGEKVADAVRSQGIRVGGENGSADEIDLPVLVSDEGSVVLAHPAGAAVQAKHGALTRAASAVGVRVTSD